jgi:predicted phosphate transport protein (TIGR00153 family)
LSDLEKWFEKRRENKAIELVQQHLTIAATTVEDLEKAIAAATKKEEKEERRLAETVANGEREADKLRRKVMHEISKGELSPTDREDLMNLVKKVDMVADWSRESTRILGAIPMVDVPASIKDELIEMILNIKKCAVSLQKCVNMIKIGRAHV